MSPVEGGTRDRLVAHSVHYLVRSILDDRGWFDPGRHHTPVTLIDRDPGDNPSEQPADNTVAVFDQTRSQGDPVELGSGLTYDSLLHWADVFAANDSVGRDISGDILAGLEGKLTAIGRTRPILVVYDFRLATPAELFTCDIVDLGRDQGHDDTRPWRRHWWSVHFTIEDIR